MASNPSDVSLQLAHTVIEAAVRRAEELDLKMNVAVVDVGANLKAFNRMDGAWLGSIDISIKKARTARYFDMGTSDLTPMVQPGESLYHIEFSNNGLITFPGGDRKSTRLNSSHVAISYAVFCLKKKKNEQKAEITTTRT